jgi:hypothetical protein
MINKIGQSIGLFRRAEFLSPKDLLQRAVAISLLFLVVHLAGFREFTSVLNGTIGSMAAGWKLSGYLALIYILLYLAFVILVPVLILAALILTIWQGWVRKRGNTNV